MPQFICSVCKQTITLKCPPSKKATGVCKSCTLIIRNKTNSHGVDDSFLMNTWHNIRKRCTHKHHPKYHLYGGRGISICFETPLEFANHVRSLEFFGVKRSLDRINNDGNYEIGNLRWATQAEQTRNTRRSKYYDRIQNLLTLVDYDEHYLRQLMSKAQFMYTDAEILNHAAKNRRLKNV